MKREKGRFGDIDIKVMNERKKDSAVTDSDFEFMDFDDEDEADKYFVPEKKILKDTPKKCKKKKKTVKKGSRQVKKGSSKVKKGGKTSVKTGTKAAAMSRNRRCTGKKKGIGQKIAHMETIDRIVASTGALVLIFAVVTCTMYTSAKAADRQVASFEEVGTQMEGIKIIGEDGLLAVSDAQASRAVLDEVKAAEEPKYEEKELKTGSSVEVVMNLSSMQKDLKIKFTNKKTGKLVANVPFEVKLTDADGKEHTWKDEDEDGIIYHTDMTAGKCSVAMEPVAGAEDYVISSESVSVTIKDQIEYKKVNVVDEVKTEAEVNAAIEDTKIQETVVESVLTDTVPWVESTKTQVNGNGNDAGYEEVSKDKITDPSTLVKAAGFLRFSAASPVISASGNTSVKVGETTTLTCTAPEGATGVTVTWSGGSDGLAIDPVTGIVTATAAGSAAFTATCSYTVTKEDGTTETQTATASVTVTSEAPVTVPVVPEAITVSLDQTGLSMKTGESATLTAVTAPAGNAVEWGSDNAGIASVTGGTVTAVAPGTANITAKTSTGHLATCTVTVAEKAKPVLTLNASSLKVLTEKTASLTATVQNAEDKSVTYSSDNTGIASVSSDGTVTGISAGTAVITAVSNADPSISAVCNVTVVNNPKKDNTTKLKDNDGNQLYVKNADGTYREAVYADYDTADKFYKASQKAEYKYTGWQTIDNKTYFFDANGNKVTGEQVIQGAKYSFDSDGALNKASGNMGIDVSKWNGNIDWNAVKNSGVSYVIIRCGYRGSTTGALIEDPKFRANIKGASAAGLKVGIYFFTQAVNEVEAVEEASMVLGLIGGYGISYPVFLDVEKSGGRADGIDKNTRTAVCKAFCQTIQNSGYKAGIYANKTWLTSYINTGSLSGFKIWLAQYAAAPTYSATKYDMWQYSSKETVAGISGSVDMNISYMGY